MKELLEKLARRDPASHKGSFGRLALWAGSEKMSGCLLLAALGALRSGVGILECVSVPRALDPLRTGAPEAVTTPLTGSPASDTGTLLLRARAASALALGPGLASGDTRGSSGAELRAAIGALSDETACPVVLDADALTAVGTDTRLLAGFAGRAVLTPHPGELARLTGSDAQTIMSDREGACRDFARKCGCTVLLKGHATVISDGERVEINTTGNPFMARGGSGDVLTGVIGSLLAQGFKPFDAARLGAFLHGGAGDLARDELGLSMLPSDIPPRLGRFLKSSL